MDIQWNGLRVLVLGTGKSGLAAAELLRSNGAVVLVADQAPEETRTFEKKALEDMGAACLFGSFPDPVDLQMDLVVISPGIPRDNPVVHRADRAGIPVWGELELAGRFIGGPLVAITGTNGKTTTTAWICHILEQAGRKAVLGGNIGVPLTAMTSQFSRDSVGVVEVSSYQLETVDTFHPAVAVITNLTPDHMERHKTMENYLAVKARIFARQSPEDTVVLNADDSWLAGLTGQIPGRLLQFSVKHTVKGACLADGQLLLTDGDRPVVLVEASRLLLPGSHNIQNALAAVCAVRAMGLGPEEIRPGLLGFSGVEHRLEPVATVEGVRYINDSKATNPESVLMALESFREPLILILGGSPKQTSYRELAQEVARRGIPVVVSGQTRDEIVGALEEAGARDIHPAENFRQAVDQARGLARPGDVILLSPACASFDEFRNFEHRGSVFKEIVNDYHQEEEKAGTGSPGENR